MIKFIYSKTTKGQTDHLKTLVGAKHSLDEFDLIIAEDRFTLTLENELLDAIDGKTSFSFNVYSFARLASTLAKEKGNIATLSKTGGVMAISKILLEIGEELKCYKRIAGSYSSLSASLFEVIAQLKSSMISYSDLLNTKSPSIALTNKAYDIGRVFEEYEKFKTKNILDAQDKTELLAELVVDSKLIKNSRVIVIGFTSFTKQFYRVLGKIFATARECIVYILDGENEIYDKSVAINLKDAATAVNKEYEEIHLDEKLDGEHFAINKYLFSFVPKEQIVPTETDKISIKKCADLSKELETVAVDILSNVKRGDRFSDFAVLCSSINNSGDVIEKTFGDYGIPAFFDKKIKLSDHILSKTVVSILKLASDEYIKKSSSSESLLTVLYSPYIEGADEDKQGFENYLLKKGIKRSTLKKPLDDELFELIRAQIFSLVPKFPSVANVSTFVTETKTLLLRILDENEIAYYMFELAGESEFAALTLQSGEKFNDVLDEMARLIGDTTITLNDFTAILFDGLSSKELSLAPLYSDSVFVGDFSSSKILSKKHLYAVSVNNKLVPLQKSDVGLLTDKDIDGLLPCGVDLEPKIELVNEREKLNVFLSLMNFENSLTLSFSEVSTSLEVLGESEIISAFGEMFTHKGHPLSPDVEERFDISSDQKLAEYIEKKLPSKKVIEKAASAAYSDKDAAPLFMAANAVFNKHGERIFSDARRTLPVKAAFKNKKEFSVSDLESYFSCPYKNFVAHSLYAKDREEAVIKAADSGNYIHKALEIFMKELDTLSDEEAIKYAKTVTRELKKEEPYATMNRISRFSVALSRLDKEFDGVAKELVNRRSRSAFSRLGEEIRFGYGKSIAYNGKTYELSPLVLKNGERLRGSIDYADVCDGHARVIDYKTGVIHKSLDEVYCGHKFQPYIYLSALYKSLGLLPAGALYFPIHADFSDGDDAPYKMQGYVLSDDKILNDMDYDLRKTGNSDIINVRIKKDGGYYKTSSVLSASQFEDVMKYSEELAKKATDEIRQGNIAPKPYEGACKYCDYKGICGYDISLDGERKVSGKVSVSTISEAIKDE